jgi:hypothetical protein
MRTDSSSTPFQTRKPFLKMQIEKVSLRTKETMGITACKNDSIGTSDIINTTCHAPATKCHN